MANPETSLTAPTKLGLTSGIGLVVANMMGVGVLITAGYLVQDMSATWVMTAWVVGLALALCGVVAYSGLAASVGRSGGEYRFLSDVLHPVFGVMAGWASLFVGFSAPIAISAIALGAFAKTIGLPIDERITAIFALFALSLLHAGVMKVSVGGQNILVALKVIVITLLVLFGLAFGNWALPDWENFSTRSRGTWMTLIQSQYWIAFAFSGWNSAIYCIDEFRHPKRDVGRAMFLGCLSVGLLYLLVNWIFVANIPPEDGLLVAEYEESRITLAHILVERLLGSGTGFAVSVLIMLALFSSMSAMTFVGPRVYSEMAKDRFLPRIFAGKNGNTPSVSIILQTAIASTLIFTQTLLTILEACAAVLMVFTVLCCIANLLLPLLRADLPRPSVLSRIAALFYLVIAAAILWRGIQLSSNTLALSVLVIIILATAVVGYQQRRRS